MEKLQIQSIQDIGAFILWMSLEKGCVYHPDTAATEYCFDGSCLPVFTPYDARWVQKHIDAGNALCESIGMDPSDLASEVLGEVGACPKSIEMARPLAATDGMEVFVKEISFARAARLHHRGVNVFWVDGEGHESLCHDEETIIERAQDAWFYADGFSEPTPVEKHSTETEKAFPGGFEAWAETYFEVVAAITRVLDGNGESKTAALYAEDGRGGMYVLAERLTDEFENTYRRREWDGDYFDEIENFLGTRL
jgi:hypothetical protein